MLKRIILALSAMLISLCVSAKDLTNQEIENWLKASPSISKWLTAHENILDSEEKINFLESSPANIAAYADRVLKKNNLYVEFKNSVSAYGFNDVNRFFEVQAQIIQAYVAVSIASQNVPSAMNQELLNALAEIEQAEGLSKEQKAQMKEQLTNMMGQVMQLQDTTKNKADQEKIKPYFEQLNNAFESFQ